MSSLAVAAFAVCIVIIDILSKFCVLLQIVSLMTQLLAVVCSTSFCHWGRCMSSASIV